MSTTYHQQYEYSKRNRQHGVHSKKQLSVILIESGILVVVFEVSAFGGTQERP
jgi:hypothetical protein